MNAKNLFVVAAICAACSRDAADRGAHAADSAAAPIRRASATAGYVGSRTDPRPAGVKLIAGNALANSDYSVSYVSTPKGDMIWLDSARTIRAALPIAALAKDERVFISTCDVNGKLDPNVVAIVVTEPNVTRFTKIRQAWRVDPRAAAFELIPLAGITCEETG